MKLGIEKKVVLVTGGSKGIGYSCAAEFAEEGCRVVIASRTAANVEKAVDQLQAKGANVAGIAADCTTKEGIERVVKFTTETFSAPDIAIFNVDSGTKGAFLTVDDETFYQGVNNNVMAFTWLVRAVIPHMQQQKWGRILTIGTNSVKQPHRALPRAVQNTFRVGALALSKTLSAELGPYGITVNTLGTGGIATDQFKDVFTKIGAASGRTYEEQLELLTDNIPVGRIGEPEDMAAAALFLCSDRAGYITGQVLVVDGGQIESLQ